MMEKIIQLREHEYENLYKAANANEQEINEAAERLWKEKGVAQINISVSLNRDWYEETHIDCSASTFYKDKKFVISEKVRARVSENIKDMVLRNMRDSYGSSIRAMNVYKKRIRKLNATEIIIYSIAASGWAAACILFMMK